MSIIERASTANDDLFFLDSDETREDTSFEEKRQLLEKAIFVNGHLIEEGTSFVIKG